MNFALPPDLQQFTDGQIASGKYHSLEEMLVAGLQALAEREELYKGRFKELRDEILLGAEQAESGQLLDAFTEIENIQRRIRASHSHP